MSRSPRPILAVPMAAVTLLAMAVHALPLSGAACSAKSGTQTAALVELYTSEGCDSCPPADRWLASTFRGNGEVARAIPLAFHVDYWDRLGWKDRFASAAYTDRQYAAMRANHARFVYTPQVLLQGHGFPQWQGQSRDTSAAVAAVNARPPRAEITLGARAQPDGVAVQADVRVPAGGERRRATIFVALVDSGLVSEVSAGENKGARLVHDHAVRAFHIGPAVDAAGVGTAKVVLPWPREAGTDAAVVAFVQDPETGDVLQALALPLAATSCATGRQSNS